VTAEICTGLGLKPMHAFSTAGIPAASDGALEDDLKLTSARDDGGATTPVTVPPHLPRRLRSPPWPKRTRASDNATLNILHPSAAWFFRNVIPSPTAFPTHSYCRPDFALDWTWARRLGATPKKAPWVSFTKPQVRRLGLFPSFRSQPFSSHR